MDANLQAFVDNSTAALSNRHVLTVVVLLAVGFFLRTIRRFPNDLIPATIAVVGILAGIVYLQDMTIWPRVGHGLTYAAFSCFIYELVVKRLQNWLAAKYGRSDDESATAVIPASPNTQPPQEKK